MYRSKILLSLCNFLQHSPFSCFTVKEALQIKPVGNKIVVKGWVQAIRKHRNLYFVDLKDGTCLERLQIIFSESDKYPSYGSSIRVEGSLAKSSHKGQDIELIAENWSTYGSCSSDYPFEYRQKYSSDYIRQFLHLRPRTRKISSILRIRSNASVAVHQFFQKEGFQFIHTPIITRNDCEGAGEVFSVQLKQKPLEILTTTNMGSNEIGYQKADHDIARNNTDEHKKVDKVSGNDPEHFFNDPAYLTVSGQLHLEAMACALSRVYNFGPVFRAENSQTKQHASEFHMIEAEIAFLETVEELIKMVEGCIKHVAKSIFDNCYPDVKFLFEDSNVKEEYLEKIIAKPFIVMSYNEAMKVLECNEDKLKVPIKWGDDLSNDHKNFMVNFCNNIPVFITMFPSSLKPFYMKTDENRKEAYCFDLFASYGGEICGGSLRENDEKILKSHPHLDNPSLSWYLDLRKYGAVPHGGFGIGFDRLLQSLIGISNIRDVIPFPRRKHDCKC